MGLVSRIRSTDFKEIVRFCRDYLCLMRSGVFTHTAYSRYHFADTALPPEILAAFALPHYLLRGRKLGYRPNPFVDPTFLADVRLSDYLRDPSLWVLALSDTFDSAWYTRANSAEVPHGENPLHHFWKRGFEARLNPTPRFDPTFFQRAIARDEPDKREYAYRYFSGYDPLAPQNWSELEEAQREFYQAVDLETLKSPSVPRKEFLVFIQAGADFVPTFGGGDLPFDLLINFYDEGHEVDGAHYVFRQRGTKVTAIRKLLEARPELFEAYNAVLFLDDDVEISADGIARLFQAQSRYGFDLLQASLSENSNCFFPALKQPDAGDAPQLVTGIEIMMPMISRRALSSCGWVFCEGISGWGIDMLLSIEVRQRFGNTIALLGDVEAVHVRPTDLANNGFYKFLSEHRINPRAEASRIETKFNLQPSEFFIPLCNGSDLRQDAAESMERPVHHAIRTVP